MHLAVTGQFVGSIIEEGLQTAQETIHITLAYLTHKALDFIRRLADAYRRIVRKQETEKPLLHLTVRETEGIVLKLRVIVLDGQITALIDDRYRSVEAASMESSTGPLVTMCSISSTG